MGTTTTYDAYPLEKLAGGEAFQAAMPDYSVMDTFLTFGKNANGDTIFKYRDGDAKLPSYWGDYTRSQYLSKFLNLSVSDDGRTLYCNLPPGYRNISGYDSNSKWVISGSGLNETMSSSFQGMFGYSQYVTPLMGIGNLPDTATAHDIWKYAGAFSTLAQGINQRYRSVTITESGLLQDIAGSIAKLGPLAPIALNFAMPGIGSAIAGALGVGSAAVGSAIGNALLATALNGGDLAAGLKAGLASYAGASLGGLAGDLAKGGDFGNYLSANPTILSNLVNNVTQTAIKGGDVKAALAGSMLSAGIGAATSQIEGFKDMPVSVQSTIQNGISQALQGKDINVAGLISGAAINGLVSYGLTQIPGYDSLEQKYKDLAATSLTTALQGGDLTKNAINWALNQATQAVAKGVADDKAKAQGWKDSTEKAEAEKVGADTPEEFKEHQQNEADKADGWESTAEKEEAEKEGFTDADEYHQNEADKEEGWSGTEEKTEAENAGFDDPTEYRQDLDDKADGWAGTQEKLDAEKVGADTPEDWKEYKADKSAEELGWVDREEKDAAEALDIHTPEDYKYHLADEAAKSEGWDNLIEKNKADAENISNPTEWKELVDDRDAQSNGWLDSEERDYAYELNLKTPDAYKYYLDDQDAKSVGWDGIDEKRLAEAENISDPGEWKELLDDRDAQSKGWEDSEERDTAQELSIFTPDGYKYYLSDEAAKDEGWTGVDAKNDAADEGITDPSTWVELLDDRDAQTNGWLDSEERDAARDVGIDEPDEYKTYVLETEAKAEGWLSYQDKLDAIEKEFDNPNEWRQYLRDEDAKSLGFDDDADRKEAEEEGFKNAGEWDEHLEEQRIIQFYQENADRDPTPEELQRFKDLFGDAKEPDEFSDEQIENLISGDIETTDYVYGPDGTRYNSEADAIADGVFDYTDSWDGPVYGSDGNKYDSPEDAIANGVFDFTGERPEDFVDEVVEEDKGTQGEVVWEGQVITDDGTIYDSAADALADGQFDFEEYIPDETDVTDEEEKPIVWEEDEEEEEPYEGPVWGPDGTEYESAEAAMAEGVFDFTESPPEEEVPEDTDTEDETVGPDEPIVWEEDEEEDVGPDEPIVWEEDEEDPGPDKPIVWEEDEEEYIGPEEPIVWEEDEEEAGPEEPIVWEEDEEEPEKPIVWEEDEEEPIVWEEDEEETTCEPGFHDDGTGLCVADDEEEETEEPDTGGTSGGTSGVGSASSRRTQILQRLAKSAVASSAFQNQISAPTNQAASPIEQAATTPEVIQQKSPLEQLGGKSIYPKRFRSVLQDYLDAIEPPEEFYAPAEGLEAPAPAEALEQQSTIEQYREPDMATSTYFNYGQPQDISELVEMQKEQDLPLGEGLGLSTAFAAGGMAAPLLMAKGGTGHGKNAHGALSIVQHSGKHRIDYRQGDAVTGAGDGQSDDIPAMLADGEFVIPADVVAALGNGSTKAGSDKLYEMMHSIRAHHRAAKPKDLPPPAKKSPLDYLKKGK